MNILLKLAFNASKLEHAFSTLSAGLAIFYLVIVFVSLKCDLLLNFVLTPNNYNGVWCGEMF